MAKHFREDAADRTAVSPRAARRAQTRSRAQGTGHVSLPYGQAATYHYSYPSAALRGDEPYDEPETRGGLYLVGRGLLLLVAWALRLAALAVFALVLLNVLNVASIEGVVTRVTDLFVSYLPWGELYALEVETPFGGVFRGDLAIISLGLFVADWLVCRLRTLLR